MGKRFFKINLTACVLTIALSSNSFGLGWQHNDHGWWYATNTENTEWYSNCWQWIDGNSDGISECYYFDNNGYMLQNTTTPDNYSVNESGAWVIDGNIQTKTQTLSNGWHKDANGWKYYSFNNFISSKFKKIDGKTYFFDDTGYMYTGFHEIDGLFYYFDESGALKKSSFNLDGYHYIVDSTEGYITDMIDEHEANSNSQDLFYSDSYSKQDDYYISHDENNISSTTNITEEEAKTKLYELMEQYPEGKKWNNSNKYQRGNRIGYGCAGFAYIALDKVFGKNTPLTKYDVFDISNIHIGDHFRIYNNSGGEHSVIIFDISETGVELAEGNYNSKIHWGRKMSFDTLESNYIYHETAY